MAPMSRRDKAVRILQIRDGAPPPPPADVDAITWRQIFEDGRHLTARDERLVALLCRLIADARDLRSLITAEGRIVDGARGSRTAHPAARMLKDTEASIVAVSSALVLTPAARARAAMAQEPQPEDRIDAYRDKMALLARISGASVATPPEDPETTRQGHEQDASRRRPVRRAHAEHPAGATNGNNRHKEKDNE